MADFLPLPDRQYSVIYADPPWEYRQHGATAKSRGNAVKHYPTMPTADICKLPVREICGGGQPAFYGQPSQTLPRGSRSWRRGGSSTKRPLSCGSRHTPRAGGHFGVWARTREPMRRCVCWVCPRDLRLGSGSVVTGYTRSLRPPLRGTAKSQTKHGGGSWNCWGTCHGWNCSPGTAPQGGTHGGTRFRRRNRRNQ